MFNLFLINKYMETYTYFYQGAFKDYILQFLRIFSGFQVEYQVDRDDDGKKDRKTCSVVYGDMDRVVANVLHKDGTFVPTSLPMMSGVLTAIDLNPEERRSRYHEDNIVRTRGTDGTQVVTQRIMGTPYKLTMDLSIYTSNNTQMFQLLEQILILFNPKLTIQKSNNTIDWSYLTEVELISITQETNIPAGQDERMIVYTLSFSFDAWLDYPMKESAGIIKTIEANIKDNTNDPVGVDLENIVIS